MSVNGIDAKHRDAKHRIVAVAGELMAERGFAGTSIAEIAKRSECAPPTIYWHFGSKEGLLHAVLREGADSHFGAIRKMARLAGTADERLDKQLNAAAVGLEKEPPFIRLLLLLTLERRSDDATLEVIRVARARACAQLGLWFAAYFDELSLTNDGRVIDRVAELALALTDGLVLEHILNPGTADIAGAMRSFRISLPSLVNSLSEPVSL
ncbi:MAG: helix-turn-helix domain-containing protein [Acidimicrobiales bacterium]